MIQAMWSLPRSASPFLKIAIANPISSISILKTVLTLKAYTKKAIIFYILNNLFYLLLSLLYKLVYNLLLYKLPDPISLLETIKPAI
jgi:hypothetical protein